MTLHNKRRIRVVLNYCIGWTIAFLFLVIIRGVGTIETGKFRLDFVSGILLSISMGPMMGILTGTAQIWMEEKVYKRISIFRFLMLRLLFAITFLILLVLVAYLIFRFFLKIEIDLSVIIFDRGVFPIYLYVLSVDFTLNFLRQINLMLGSGNLSKYVLGRFYHPREEERIFMFVDMHSSTQFAEKLGHIKYSLLVQDCFLDLSVVIEDDAEIYQYVGDEAVLTWKEPLGKSGGRFLRAFYRFKDQLKAREDYYMEEYGVMPYFKAGAHAGHVTVTEIGKYKKEIAFHGDPLNTASRMQKKCNELNEEFLISESLKKFVDASQYQLQGMGSILLRGKQEEVAMYAVTRFED